MLPEVISGRAWILALYVVSAELVFSFVLQYSPYNNAQVVVSFERGRRRLFFFSLIEFCNFEWLTYVDFTGGMYPLGISSSTGMA